MRPEKATIVDELTEVLNQSPFLLLVDYGGLSVQHFQELRDRLAASDAKCKVIKNRFLKRAADGLELPDLGDQLAGQNAIITGDADICATAKVVKTFAAEFEKPAFRCGLLDGKLLSAEEVKVLADLPSREVLLAQFLGVLEAPAAKLVRLLNEPASGLARVLKAKSEKG